MRTNHKTQSLMKNFWNERAKENAPFYIATWRGWQRKDVNDFFINAEEARKFLADAGYTPRPSDRMLEIGCGIGRMTHGFAPLFGEVQAIDVSGEMICQAQKHLAALPNVHAHETNGVDLDIFADNYFDFCFSYIVFQHIPTKEIIFNYIKEVGRTLKPSGTFHFQVRGLADPDRTTPALLLRSKRMYRALVRRPLLSVWRVLSGGPRGYESPAWSGVTLSAEEVRVVLEANCMTIAKCTGEGTDYMWITAYKQDE